MNGVLVILEQQGGDWHRMSWEALAAGQELAARTGQPLLAAVAGDRLETLLPELQKYSLTKAYGVSHPLLALYTADGFTAALEQLIRQVDPAYVVFPHTYQVRDFGPKLATRFRQVLIADVIAVQGEGSAPVFVRQLLQGKLNADYRHAGSGPCFLSVQAGAFRSDGLAPGTAEVDRFAPQLDAAQIRNQPGEPFRAVAAGVDLTSAPVIVSVGRGIKEKENLEVVEQLAQALDAELAASRPICDNGWLPMERQIGSSGATVSPKLYIAIGISGAIQHLVGMKGAKTIVAINKDKSAPIFEVADYGIVGDLFEVVPALTAAVQKSKSG